MRWVCVLSLCVAFGMSLAGAATLTCERKFYDAGGANPIASYVVGVDITVQLEPTFDGAYNLFAAEEIFPDGWSFLSADPSATVTGRRVSWNLTGNPRTLSYVVRPAATDDTVTFTGTIGGFADGASVVGTLIDSELEPNQAPTKPGIAVTASPSPATTVSDLTCQVTAPSTDPDNNPPGGAIEYRFTWTRGRAREESDWTAATIDVLDAADTSKGEWTVEVRARDALGAISAPATGVVNVLDTPPTDPTQITIHPTEPQPEDDIAATASGSTDADGDTVTYDFRWTKLSRAGRPNTVVTGAVLSADDTTLGDVWKLEAAASADGVRSAWVQYANEINITSFHPADTNKDRKIDISEFLEYAGPVAEAWQEGANGGEYEWDGTTLTPKPER